MVKTKKDSQGRRKVLLSARVQLAAAAVLFWLSALMVSDGTMMAWERVIFQLVYGLPESLKLPFLVITQLGGITMLLALSIVYIIKSHYSTVTRLLMSGLLAYLLAGVGKDLVGRGRPHEFFTDFVYRDALIRGPGFPSGHMALATAIGLTLWHYLPRRSRWLAPALIIGVGLSRVYLGAHAPLDIVGGFAIGWASVTVFHFVRLTDIRKKA